jgi:hypothetical protein
MVPSWLHTFAVLFLVLGFLCAGIIAVDILRHPQHMAIMDIVWPVTALFGTLITVWGYFRYGRLVTSHAMRQAKSKSGAPRNKTDTPFPVMVAKGASHCGSGCCIGDICAEWLAYLVPAIAVWFGWHKIFSEKMFAVWILDFVFAFILTRFP